MAPHTAPASSATDAASGSEDTAVRPVDVVLAVVLSALGVYLMVENIVGYGHHPDVRIDSGSWLQLPVWLAATVPLVWWRRRPLAIACWVAVVLAVHVVAFGWLVRCGSGLPLAWVTTFRLGTRDELRRSLLGLGVGSVITTLVLVEDSAAGPGLIAPAVVIGGALWAVGRVVRQRTRMAAELRVRTAELATLRDQRAALELDDDRARMSGELETLLQERLEQLSLAAQAAASDGSTERTQAVMAGIEAESRRTLAEMREILGTLRGEGSALSPSPSVANLDALVARHGTGDTRLTVTGEPRALPASVELSVYRIVEHLLGVLGGDDPRHPLEVAVGFADDALEVRVAGPVQRGADVRAAVARARERARLQEGRLVVRVSRSRARAVARVPVALA